MSILFYTAQKKLQFLNCGIPWITEELERLIMHGVKKVLLYLQLCAGRADIDNERGEERLASQIHCKFSMYIYVFKTRCCWLLLKNVKPTAEWDLRDTVRVAAGVWAVGVCQSASMFCFVLVPDMGVPLAHFFVTEICEKNVFNSNPQFYLPSISLSLKLLGSYFCIIYLRFFYFFWLSLL